MIRRTSEVHQHVVGHADPDLAGQEFVTVVSRPILMFGAQLSSWGLLPRCQIGCLLRRFLRRYRSRSRIWRTGRARGTAGGYTDDNKQEQSTEPASHDLAHERPAIYFAVTMRTAAGLRIHFCFAMRTKLYCGCVRHMNKKLPDNPVIELFYTKSPPHGWRLAPPIPVSRYSLRGRPYDGFFVLVGLVSLSPCPPGESRRV